MRTRNLLAVLALTAATGLAAAGTLELADRALAPATASAHESGLLDARIVAPPTDGVVRVDEPTAPRLGPIVLPTERLELTPLEPRVPPFPRYEAFRVAGELAAAGSTPPSPPPIAEPEAPDLGPDPVLAVVYVRPELRPAPRSAPAAVRAPRCCLAESRRKGRSDHPGC